AVRRAQRNQHTTLEQLTSSLIQSRTSSESPRSPLLSTAPEKSATASVQEEGTSRVILSVCLTGFGSASKIAELIVEHIPELQQSSIEIICMDINLSGKTAADIQRMVGHRQIIAVVGTINPHLESYPFISLTELLFGDGITRLRTLAGNTLIDPTLLQPEQVMLPTSSELALTQRSDLFREITYTLSQHMFFLNPIRILPLIERMIEMIEVETGETFEIEVLAGLVMHLACVLERGTQQNITVDDSARERIETHFGRDLEICRRTWQILGKQIARALPADEPYNIVSILRNIDIFTNNITS
ncbi:MAG: PRD domain-containing protein, partial [Ktedonobacteraceae bacterium]|nr:PRD domain-containing protein [Ktedonobacteraceae bacterium]